MLCGLLCRYNENNRIVCGRECVFISIKVFVCVCADRWLTRNMYCISVCVFECVSSSFYMLIDARSEREWEIVCVRRELYCKRERVRAWESEWERGREKKRLKGDLPKPIKFFFWNRWCAFPARNFLPNWATFQWNRWSTKSVFFHQCIK